MYNNLSHRIETFYKNSKKIGEILRENKEYFTRNNIKVDEISVAVNMYKKKGKEAINKFFESGESNDTEQAEYHLNDFHRQHKRLARILKKLEDANTISSKEVEIKYKTNIEIIEEHEDIFKEIYEEARELFRELKKKLGRDERNRRAGFNAENIHALLDVYHSFHDFKEEGKTSDEDCDKLLKATEKMMDILKKLKDIKEDVEKAGQQESHGDIGQQA